MQRVLIIGSPGAGKSTLAKGLAARTGLPLIHLDDLYWEKEQLGQQEVARSVWQQRLQDALDSDAWIMDGNYNSTIAMRAARADTVLFLIPPRELCLWRVLQRELSGRHPHFAGTRPRWPGWDFLLYTWHFPKKVTAMLERVAKHRPLYLVILRSDREVQAWLNTVQNICGQPAEETASPQATPGSDDVGASTEKQREGHRP
ncbi:DNA topology modulation protein FlaR [Deinococcus aluminii]|uniref:AAA family ATPase n=1 Tax=Deinococcus aluminii TaxID=1656885 RepID=A0ABP9XI31_9DEIO